MTQHRITPMAESGLLAAMTVVLAMLAVYLPVLGMVAALIWALPILVLVVRHGIRWGIMAVLVSGVCMAFLIEPIMSLRMVLAFAPAGLLLGIGFRRHWSSAKVFGAAFLASLVGKLAALALIFAITAVNPLAMDIDSIRTSFEAVFQMYESMGIDADKLAKAHQEMEDSLMLLQLLMPLVVLMMGLSDTVVSYLLGTRVLRRLGESVEGLPPFAEWRLPSFFLYLFGFALVGIYWGGTRDIQLLYQISINANMVAIFAGLIQGLALTHCVMRHYKLATVARILIIVIIITSGFLTQLVALTGLFDMLFDYRRRFAARGEK
ncbi:MAG: YybS family protein [Selenomonas sp.]|uniref:YybS family protein n=1 Tax=Selenomonas sp. TaxID=2053611 RepID=UPI0025FE5B84|nr:YybS family protein [Selenomonas sp.]MCR5438607.1 YybS family protein [Selenomonas sp.]